MPINITTIISAIIYFTILMLVFVNLKKLFKRMWLRIEKIKYEELNEDINKESEDIEDKKKLIREQKKKIKETEEEIQKEEGTKPKKEQNKKK